MFKELRQFAKEAWVAFKNLESSQHFSLLFYSCIVSIALSLIWASFLAPVGGKISRGVISEVFWGLGLYAGATAFFGALMLVIRSKIFEQRLILRSDWTDSRHKYPSFSNLVGALDHYMADAEVIGGALMLEEAKQLMASLPGIAREYVALREAHDSTQSDLKKQMYKGTVEGIEARLARATELFSSEHARLLESARDVGNAHVEKELAGLSSIYTLDAVVEDLEVISSSGEQVSELTPEGADPLARQIEALRKPEVKQLRGKTA